MTREGSTAIAKRAGSAFAIFQPVLEMLPPLEDDPTPRMMEIMLNAASPAEWETVFQSQSLKGAVDKRFRIHGVRWSRSQFAESLTGVFLICDVTDLETGERDVLTVGADVAMAQVLNLVKTGNLPWDVAVTQKATPTAAGYYPIHLTSLGRPAGSAD